MPNLRDTLKQTSGVDVGGNEFTLTETDITPYVDNPGMAQMEADVTLARYGGSPIQDKEVEKVGPWRDTNATGQQPAPQTASTQGGPIDLSRRADFERSVFKQLASETMPDGNPFAFNPTASLNAISKQDLPELFNREFQGQVSWQDRHLLDDDQKKYWTDVVKRYRAHVDQALRAEREAAINSYNQMMNSFDNAAKEQEAIRKRQLEKEKRAMQAATKVDEKQSKREKAFQEALSRRTELLGLETKLVQDYSEREANGTLTEQEANAMVTQLTALRDERKEISKLILKRKPRAKESPAGTRLVTAHGKKQGAGKGGKTVVKTGTYKGRKVVQYSDGSVAYADETK